MVIHQTLPLTCRKQSPLLFHTRAQTAGWTSGSTAGCAQGSAARCCGESALWSSGFPSLGNDSEERESKSVTDLLISFLGHTCMQSIQTPYRLQGCCYQKDDPGLSQLPHNLNETLKTMRQHFFQITIKEKSFLAKKNDKKTTKEATPNGTLRQQGLTELKWWCPHVFHSHRKSGKNFQLI